MKKRTAAMLALLLSLPFSAAAAAEQNELYFIADLHLTAQDASFVSVLRQIREHAAEHGTLILLGDTANNGRAEEHARILRCLKQVSGDGTEVYVLPGNHDLYAGFAPERFRELYADYGWKQAFSREPDGLSYAVMTGGVCLLMLDVNEYVPEKRMAMRGLVHPSTLAWLEELLPTLPAGTPVAACGHYPILPYVTGTDDTEGARELAETLRRHGVKLYLCGHRHANYTLSADGLRQIAVGTPTGYPAWAGVVQTVDGGFDYRTEAIPDPFGEEYRTMRDQAWKLGVRMGAGSLKGTPYEGDTEAIGWFADAFLAYAEGTIGARADELLADPGCKKWRQAEVKVITRDWILSQLEARPEDIRAVSVR